MCTAEEMSKLGKQELFKHITVVETAAVADIRAGFHISVSGASNEPDFGLPKTGLSNWQCSPILTTAI